MASIGSGPPGDFAATLLDLGFSQYEARCYVGLLGLGPQTGYAVAKTTGVPQPKVYEALRKLVARNAARQLAGEPVRFEAVAPQELLDGLEAGFDRRLATARMASADIELLRRETVQELLTRTDQRAGVLSAATAMIVGARRRVYLSASSTELGALQAPVSQAVTAGIDVVVLCFGPIPFERPPMRVFRHASTDGSVYRRHQAHHVAMVVDSRETIFAIAADGRNWTGIQTDSAPVIAAVKGYIRHDIDMQQVFADFGPQLVDAYGPGLQALESYRSDPRPAKKASRRPVLDDDSSEASDTA